jgi:hypothetical protein
MRLSRLISRYRQLTPERRVALWEAACKLALAQVAVHVLPFRWLTGGLGQPRAESPAVLPPEVMPTVHEVGWAIGAIVRRLPKAPKCLVQAVAAQWMLRRRGIAGTLYLGVARNPARSLSAHAWVRCGEFFVTGGRERQSFTVVAQFASNFDL